MKTITATDIKHNFSPIIHDIESGEEIVISNGKKTIVVIIPYKTYRKAKKRELGTLKGKVSVEFLPGYQLSDEDFLYS
jgi:prevent-host-death family protein